MVANRIGTIWALGYMGACAAAAVYGAVWGTPSWIRMFSFGMG